MLAQHVFFCHCLVILTEGQGNDKKNKRLGLTLYNLKIMLKITLFSVFFTFIVRVAGAQVAPTANMFQNSMAPFQATALPYNYLDKFESSQELQPTSTRLRPNQKSGLQWYLNASNRTEIYPETGVSLRNIASASVVTADFVRHLDKMSYKIGGGILNNDLELVQYVSPFAHFSLGMPMNLYWQLVGGFSYRFSMPRFVNELGYQHMIDPKINQAKEMNHATYHSAGVSIAAVHAQNCYIGFGVNRLLSTTQFITTKKSNFTEFNFLCQAVVWKRYQSNFVRDKETSKKVENPSRGFLSNVNMSVAMRYLYVPEYALDKSYPLYAQVSCRTTLTNQLWTGIGWNTANRVQWQIGLMKLPLFKQEVEYEWYIWAAYDFPTHHTPYHGTEINLGCYF
jgi:hypothetical protein